MDEFKVTFRTAVPTGDGGYTMLDKKGTLPFVPQLHFNYGIPGAEITALTVKYNTETNSFLVEGRIVSGGHTRFLPPTRKDTVQAFKNDGWVENEELSR